MRTVEVSKKYTALIQSIPVEDRKWLASVLPQNVGAFNQLRTLMAQGRTGLAVMNASPLGEQDPGIEMLYAVGLYQQQATSEGYHAMLKSEAMKPRHPFRCWALIQCALAVGDIKIVEREAEHLKDDPEYGKPSKLLLERIRALG
jgi:hypothetical protein